jgi:hypothetical protein
MNMSQFFSRFFLGAFVFTIALSVSSQEILKHPRVVELEDSLKNNASEYIKSRFPSAPFMVQVRVDPLRRDTARSGGSGLGADRELPYYSAEDEEEIRDEWDNPQFPLNGLLNRVKRINVDISVPGQLKESEVTELKQGIFQVLHLTPARDEVDISRRDWSLNEFPWMTIYIALGVLVAFLIGLLAITRQSTSRIASALKQIKIDGQQNSRSSSAPAFKSNPSESLAKSQSQELKFNDPVRMKELARKHVDFLLQVEFPNHLDMYTLDHLGKNSPEKLGAILMEFPADVQKRIFSLSKDFFWVQALNKPGFLDFECLETLQTLSQNLRVLESQGWSRTVLAVWRLGFQLTDFVKKISKEEAFALLADMPKAVAISTARKAFPGSWADILNPGFRPARPKKDRLDQIYNQAVQLVPLSDLSVVTQYREEIELLNFLKLVDPVEERDIYGAASSSSIIHSQRPPFFPIFDLTDMDMKDFVAQVPFEMWSQALFNIPKSERAKVDTHFSEKQKFILIERFKSFDAEPPSAESIGKVREQIGAILHKWMIEKAMTASDENINPKIDEQADDDDANRAA